jgi:CubicO group peptidase (beta-lactamase class C family)
MVRWRRASLPILLVAAYAYLQCAPRAPSVRSALDEDMPRPTEPIAAATAPGTIDELRRQIDRILEREHIAGAAIALIGRDGPIWVGGVGVRDRGTREPIDGDTVFRVGSLSKSVIALGVMRLVDQGKLDLDRPLREILPDLEIDNAWEAVAPVTLAQCLEHTTGFDDIRFNEIFAADERISVADTLALNPRSRRTRWRPGTRHGYANGGYTVAARAIEVAAGEPFDSYLRREILAPMGIVDADFHRTSLLESRLASGYMESDEPIVFRPFAHRPSGGLLASAADLGKLVKYWIARGEGYPPIVSRAGLARIERSGTLPYPTVDGAYGFANYGDVMHPVISRGHDGGMPGFHASFRYVPDLDVGYALLLNSNYTFRGYFELRALLFAYLTKGRTFPPPPIASSIEKPGATFFALENPRNEVFAFVERLRMGWGVTDAGDHLDVVGLDGWKFPLIPTPDGGYRFPRESGSTVRFTTNGEGKPIMLLSFLYAEAGDEWWAQLKLAALGIVMMLLRLAVPWALAMLVLGAVEGRRLTPLSVLSWPSIASLCCAAIPRLLDHAFFAGVIGEVHLATVTLCGVTIGFALASIMTLVTSVRVLLRPDRPSVFAMVFPLACGIAFTGMALWLGVNGMIGLRTWAW